MSINFKNDVLGTITTLGFSKFYLPGLCSIHNQKKANLRTGLYLDVIGRRASNKSWALMSVFIVATVKREDDNRIMTSIQSQGTQ